MSIRMSIGRSKLAWTSTSTKLSFRSASFERFRVPSQRTSQIQRSQRCLAFTQRAVNDIQLDHKVFRLESVIIEHLVVVLRTNSRFFILFIFLARRRQRTNINDEWIPGRFSLGDARSIGSGLPHYWHWSGWSLAGLLHGIIW
jgi:hypothetical protein